MAWPVSVEPRPAAPPQEMEEDGSERVGLGFSPPAQAGYSVDPLDAMAAAPAPSTPPARDQAPEPPRPSKRPIPQPMEEPTSKAPTLPGLRSDSGFDPHAYPVHPGAGACEPRHVPGRFPAIPGHLAGLLTSCTEKEMVQLFDQFTGYPLATPVVTRIIEQYIPLRALAMQERVWTLQKYQKASDKSGLTEHRGLHRPAGDVPFQMHVTLAGQRNQVLDL